MKDRSFLVLLIMLMLLISMVVMEFLRSIAEANWEPVIWGAYSGWLEFLSGLTMIWLFMSSKENKPNIKKRKSSQEESVYKTDINNADINELRALPFINTALAKRIVKKRGEINGFKSVEDVCLYLKFNTKKSIKFREHICINPREIPLTEIRHDERSVDW